MHAICMYDPYQRVSGSRRPLFAHRLRMNHLWNARVLNRPLAEASNLYSKPTQVQILDVTRAADGTIGTARVLVGEGMQSSLPELSNETVIRWM